MSVGALNLTRKAQKQSQEAEIAAITATDESFANSERQCKRALTLYNRSIEEVNTMQNKNDRTISLLQNRLDELYDKIPDLNEKVIACVKGKFRGVTKRKICRIFQ